MSRYAAQPLREILPRVHQWSVASARYTLESYLIDEPGSAVAIDPQELAPRLAAEVQERIAHIVLTNHFHERAAAILQRRREAQVWARAADVAELEAVTPDHVYDEATELPVGLRAIALGGVGAGEDALLWPRERGVFFDRDGDALGTTSYWMPEAGRLGAHPRLRPPRPLRRLLEVGFASLAVGHGEPILDTAKAELRAYLEQATRDC